MTGMQHSEQGLCFFPTACLCREGYISLATICLVQECEPLLFFLLDKLYKLSWQHFNFLIEWEC